MASIGEAQEIESMDIDNVIKIVEEGGEDALTEEEYAEYSNYVDEHFISSDPKDHNANLADHIDDKTWLNKLAQDVIEWVETDLSSRKDWMNRESRGIRLLGVSNKTVGGASFSGASRVTHPLLIEACTQFQARAISEMWPSGGPVSTTVVGETSDERLQQADRVKGYLNYQYTTDMPGAFEEEDKMLFRLPMSGSCFKKIVYDPLVGSLVSRFIESSAFIVPYSATDLSSAVRYTEKYEETGNDTNKKIAAGVYISADLGRPDTGDTNNTVVEDEIDSTEGRQFVEYQGDHSYNRYECYCFLDIPGFEDKDIDGNKTNVNLPYIVTVDDDNQVVLAIRRNWKARDERKKRRVLYTHYRFLPGLGFYGYGLVHAIGGLAESATGALRSLLDAAGLANTKGGFRSRDARIKGGDVPIGMGEWKEVDSTMDELKKAFFPLPYDEPSQTMFNLLGMIDDLGRRFASTTENMVGDANNNGPVGTTLALIEQGSKVFSAIHLRLHHAHAKEYKTLAELNAEYLPMQYPYSVAGADRMIYSADFDDKVDVIPVSDPNIISNTQRITLAQSVLELANNNPDLYDMKAANRMMLEAMRVSKISELMPNDNEILPMDPVSEMAAIYRREPIKAFQEHDHEAHMVVHEAIFKSMNEQDQGTYGPAYMAHIAEHKAFNVKLAFEELIGGAITPENQEQATQAAAQAAQVYIAENPPSDEDVSVEGEEKRKNAAAMGNIQRQDMESSARIVRENDEAAARIEMEAMRGLKESLTKGAEMMGLDKG